MAERDLATIRIVDGWLSAFHISKWCTCLWALWPGFYRWLDRTYWLPDQQPDRHQHRGHFQFDHPQRGALEKSRSRDVFSTRQDNRFFPLFITICPKLNHGLVCCLVFTRGAYACRTLLQQKRSLTPCYCKAVEIINSLLHGFKKSTFPHISGKVDFLHDLFI